MRNEMQLGFTIAGILCYVVYGIIQYTNLEFQYTTNLLSFGMGMIILSIFFKKERSISQSQCMMDLKKASFEVLKNEAIRRGYVPGVCVKKTVVLELTGEDYALDNEGSLYYDGISIYKNGLWAPIVGRRLQTSK